MAQYDKCSSWASFSLMAAGDAVSNKKSTMTMVNANKVNGESSYFLPATFCVIFCDSGRILDSRNPVKYTGTLEVNGSQGLAAPLAAVALREKADV
jgi:hypothetical protein